MQLSPHFTLAEALRSDAAKRLGIENTPTQDHRDNIFLTARHMEHVRQVLGNRPITVSSWYRNPQVNKAVGGVANSAHGRGLAVDFTVAGLTVLDACKALIESPVPFDQLIYEYHRWIHISFTRGTPRGQVLSKLAGTGYTVGLPT